MQADFCDARPGVSDCAPCGCQLAAASHVNIIGHPAFPTPKNLSGFDFGGFN